MKYTIGFLNQAIIFTSYISRPLQVKNSFLLFIFLVLLIIFISAILSRKVNASEYTKMFSLDNTESLRGIAILLIIINHISVHLLGNQSNNNWLINWGGYGVAMFLILSGFGIHESYKKKGIEKYWLFRRYIRIWIPYVLVTIAWLILDPLLLGIHHSVMYSIPVLFGLVINGGWSSIDFNMWFIPFILLQYLVFYFVYKQAKTTRYLKFGIFVFIISWVVLLHELIALKLLNLNIEPWGIANTIYFPLGILISMNYEYITKYISRFDKNTSLITTIFISIISFSQSFLLRSNTFWSILFIFSIFYLFKLLNFKSRFLHFIGIISYEIYLLHGPLMYRYDFIIFRGTPFITIVIYFILIVILALILKFISSFIIIHFKKLTFHLSNNYFAMFKNLIYMEVN